MDNLHSPTVYPDGHPQADDIKPPPPPPTREFPSKPKRGAKKVLLTLLVLLLIAGTGFGVWFWQQQEADDLKSRIAQLEQEKKALEDQMDIPTDHEEGVDFISQSGQYRLKYQSGWLALVCEGNEPTVFLAPDAESQALCGSEKPSLVSFTSMGGDHRAIDQAALDAYSSEVAVTDVTLNDVSGKKATYTFDGDEFVAAGTKYIQFEFFANERTYTATYSQAPEGTDHSADFESMVQTWKFSIE